MRIVSFLLAGLMLLANCGQAGAAWAGPAGLRGGGETWVPGWLLEEEDRERYQLEVEQAGETEDASFTIDLSILGDCLLATHRGQVYRGSFSWYAAKGEPDYFLSQVQDILNADDFTIANLENVLTDQIGRAHV